MNFPTLKRCSISWSVLKPPNKKQIAIKEWKTEKEKNHVSKKNNNNSTYKYSNLQPTIQSTLFIDKTREKRNSRWETSNKCLFSENRFYFSAYIYLIQVKWKIQNNSIYDIDTAEMNNEGFLLFFLSDKLPWSCDMHENWKPYNVRTER